MAFDLDTQTLLKDFQETARREALARVEQWLQSPTADHDHFEDCRGKRLEDTCEWIFRDDDFIKWIQDDSDTTDSRLLWINGNPGLGKSVLCSKIVQHVESCQASPVLYFFSSGPVRNGAEPQDIARSWISQLARRDAETLDMIRKYMETKYESRKAFPSDVWEILEKVLRSKPTKILILDGFDEFERNGDERSSFLRTLKNKAGASGTRLLVVSRDEIDIRQELSAASNDTNSQCISGWVLRECRLTADKLSSDVTRFSHHIVEQRLSKKDAQLRSKIAGSLASKSEGMFLWLKMQGDSLSNTKSLKQLQNIIDRLPIGLAETYEARWSDIQEKAEEERERAVMILRWVLYAQRPLTVGELADALSVSRYSDTYADLFADDLFEVVIDDEYISNEIIDCCKSLVGIQDAAASDTPASRTVQMSHFTVREFLYKALSKPRRFDTPELAKAYEHSVLAQLCIQYLDCADTWNPAPTEDYGGVHRPFIKYAAAYWYLHFQANHSLSTTLCKQFLRLDNVNFRKWREHYESRPIADDEDKEEKTFLDFEPSTPVYYMALFGILTMLDVPIQDIEQDLNYGRGRYGTPLAAASAKGHTASFYRLIEAGANIDAKGGIHGNALNATLWARREDLALSLLALEPDLNVKDYEDRNTLYIACDRGLKTVVERLLQGNTSTEVPDKNGKTVLGISCERGHLEVVQLLLEKNATVTETNEYGKTPLHLACQYGHVELVRLLLDKGASLVTADRDGFAPLHTACNEGHLEIVRLLLDRGASWTAVTNIGRTPFYSACLNGRTEVCQLLVDRDAANLEMPNDHGWTPLNVASDGGHLEVVKMLLKLGANVATANEDGNTPFLCACSEGRIEIAKLLIDRGEDLNAKNKDNWTAVNLAADGGHLEVVRLLLDRGADLSVANDKGWTPVNNASHEGYLEVVRLLLDRGADPNVANDSGWTPVSHASYNGHLEVVRLLLDRAADLNAKTEDCWTPVNLATNGGYLEVVRLLLDRGADPNLANSVGSTPVSRASYKGHLEVLRLLLDRGADSNLANDKGWTPVNNASHEGRLEVVRTLLDRGADPNVANVYGATPVNNSVGDKGHLEVARLLLDRGADPNVANNNGWTPVNNTSHEGHLEEVRLLLDRGADPNLANGEGWTPVNNASYKGHLEVVRLLLDRGADPNIANNNGWTPVIHAGNEGHLEVVRLLLDRGADVNIATNDGWTPVNHASYMGRLEVVRLLLDRGADSSVANNEGQTPVLVASDRGKFEMVRLLIESGVDVGDDQGTQFWTILQAAAFKGHIEVVKLLLAKRAQADRYTSKYGAALCAASLEGHIDTVRLLIDSGADVNGGGDSPGSGSSIGNALQAACYAGRSEVVQLLLERGAEIYSSQGASEYDSALHAAAHNDYKDIIAILLERHADLAARDRHGWTAEMIARAYDHEEIVDMLTPDSDGSIASSNASELGPTALVSALRSPAATVEGDGVTVIAGNTVIVGLAQCLQFRADHPMPFSTTKFYFEVKIISSSADSKFSIGVCRQGSDRLSMPGRESDSWGCHSDDGWLYDKNMRNYPFSRYGKGDVLGCGGDRLWGTLFFTKNGKYLEQVRPYWKGRIFAALGMEGRDIRIRVNFGSRPFMFQDD